jgi:hypothetical protein
MVNCKSCPLNLAGECGGPLKDKFGKEFCPLVEGVKTLRKLGVPVTENDIVLSK